MCCTRVLHSHIPGHKCTHLSHIFQAASVQVISVHIELTCSRSYHVPGHKCTSCTYMCNCARCDHMFHAASDTLCSHVPDDKCMRCDHIFQATSLCGLITCSRPQVYVLCLHVSDHKCTHCPPRPQVYACSSRPHFTLTLPITR